MKCLFADIRLKWNAKENTCPLLGLDASNNNGTRPTPGKVFLSYLAHTKKAQYEGELNHQHVILNNLTMITENMFRCHFIATWLLLGSSSHGS